MVAGSEVHIAHVLEPLPRYAYPGVTAEAFSHVFGGMRREARELLDEQAERIRGAGAKVGEAHLEVGLDTHIEEGGTKIWRSNRLAVR